MSVKVQKVLKYVHLSSFTTKFKIYTINGASPTCHCFFLHSNNALCIDDTQVTFRELPKEPRTDLCA